MSSDENGQKFRDESTIQVINRCIGLKDHHIKENNEILNKVLMEVLSAMKEHDEFFRDHFQNLVFVGSYYKGTKVGKPEEFDVNLIIKLPVKYESIKIEKGMPGFAKLKLSSMDPCCTPKWEKHRKCLSKWVTTEGYLNQDVFRQSMESLFTRVMPKLPQNEKYTVKVRKSGPAFTFWITQCNSLGMCVDLVPVLEFSNKSSLLENSGNIVNSRSCNELDNPQSHGKSRNFFCNLHNWYAVPKPLKKGEDTHLNWRMSFYNCEKHILTKHGRLKPVIRQIKKLRDTKDWKIIPSYHIETLFMHYIKDSAKNPDLGKLSGTKLFIHMLDRLKEACEKQRMTNFWDDRQNLIEAEKNQLASIIGLLGRIIKQITGDPVTMADCLLTKEELKACEEELNVIRNSRDSVVSTSEQSNETNVSTFTHDLASFVNNVSKIIIATTAGPGINDSSSTNGGFTNNGSAEIIEMLRLIRSDIGDLRQSVDQLSRRMTVLEQSVSASSAQRPQSANVSSLSRPNISDPLVSDQQLVSDAITAAGSFFDRIMNPQQWAN